MALALVIRTAVVAVALWVAELLVPGIAVGGGTTATGIGSSSPSLLIFVSGQGDGEADRARSWAAPSTS